MTTEAYDREAKAWRAEQREREEHRRQSDADALDRLAWLLSSPEWPGASGMEDVAEIVATTGRDLNQPGAEWPRH